MNIFSLDSNYITNKKKYSLLLNKLKMSVKELTDDDKTNCESIGKSISSIIRFSFDDEFRKSTFQLFGTSSTKDTETEISKRLMSMIQDQNAASVLGKKQKRIFKDKENTQEQTDASEAKEADDSSTSTDCDSSNNSQGNWLQISSQEYMKSAKRKKLNFFSQPQFSQAYEREFEFSSCPPYFSNSQPLPHLPSSNSSSNKAMNSSSEYSDDGINFCRKRFRESFKDNACKYLKRNSKSHKSLD